MTDLNDLFNLFDVRVTTVDVVTYSGDGGKEGLVVAASSVNGMECLVWLSGDGV